MTRLHLLAGGRTPDDLPHLNRLIARGHALDTPMAAGLSAALAHLFGLGSRDLAAHAYAGEGGQPGEAAWFRADPVHMLAGMHSITLFDSRHFQLGPDESDALVSALNRHFEGEIEFLAPHPLRWYARFHAPPAVEVPPLDQVAGGPVGLDLIGGPDARRLQRTAMEIQMLLHDHPVNAAREARGEAAVNGVWLWGGGTWQQPAATFDRVLADDFLARALAGAADIPVVPLAAEYGQLAGARTLVVLDRTTHHDTNWFGPALRALQRGRLEAVELTLVGAPTRHYAVNRWQSLRFWR